MSIEVRKGETLGIVGESGSGKTTLGLAILRLISSQGPIVFLGEPLHDLGFKKMRPHRRDMQIVFQDPYGSLSPRMSIADVIEEGLWVHQPNLTAAEREQKVVRALTDVGLDPATRFRYPHEFSGGQRQRIAVARAIVLEPTFVVLDEPTSALDMLIQAQIVDLLRDLQKRRELTYLFISHDLKVVGALASRLMVMRNGKVVEEGPASEVFKQSQEPLHARLVRRRLQPRDRARGCGGAVANERTSASRANRSPTRRPTPRCRRPSFWCEGFRTFERYQVALRHPRWDDGIAHARRPACRQGRRRPCRRPGAQCGRADPAIPACRAPGDRSRRTDRDRRRPRRTGRRPESRRRGASAWKKSALRRARCTRCSASCRRPGINDEYATMFLAIVDSTKVPERAGAAMKPRTRGRSASLSMRRWRRSTEGKLHNGYLIIALQWLALNRHSDRRDRRGLTD